MYFGVAAELCPSQHGRQASLWRVDPDGSAERVFSMEKDPLNVTYFLPGTLGFPGGPGFPGRLFFHTTALESDNCTFSMASEPGRGLRPGAVTADEGELREGTVIGWEA